MPAKKTRVSETAIIEYQPMMRDLAASERPRERLKHQGPQALSNAELIAILLRVGTRGENVVRVAEKLLIECKGIAGLSRASIAEVTVRYRSDELQLEIRDDGIGTATSEGLGHGLVGIRERVKIYGGEMSAGTANGGGFVLSTRLPLVGEPS